MTAPTGYTLDWSDDFSTSNLDTLKWWTRLVENNGTMQTDTDELQVYGETGNHVMTNPGLNLVAHKDADGVYRSGVIRSKHLLDLNNVGYYVEVVAKVPSYKGFWGLAWLRAETQPWPPELDIAEIMQDASGETTFNVHAIGQTNGVAWQTAPFDMNLTYADPAWNGQWQFYPNPVDLSLDYHSYAILYEKPQFTIYLDGKELISGTYDWNSPDGTAAGPAHLIVQHAIGAISSAAGRDGVDDTKLPAAVNVRSVTVYRKALPVFPPLPPDVISTTGTDFMPNGG